MKNYQNSRNANNPLLAIAIVFLVFILVAMCLNLKINLQRKENCTQDNTAVVVKLTQYERHAKNLCPTLEYTVNGKTYTVISDKTFKDINIGDTVEIKYNPNNPQEIIVEKSSSKDYVTSIILFVLLIIFLFILIYSKIQYKIQAPVIITINKLVYVILILLILITIMFGIVIKTY